MTKTISYTWQFPQSPDIVWRYLTEPELVAKWLMRTDMKAEKGADFMFFTRPLPDMQFDGNVYCRITELVQPEKLVYTWRGGPGDGTISLDSVVTWTLTPRGEGTELHLAHEGFKEDQNIKIFETMNEGWGKHIAQRLAEVLNEHSHEPAK